MKSDGDRGPGFVSGLILGALAGATTAMMLAPTTGEETRGMLEERARDLTERGKKVIEGARCTIGEAIDTGKSAANDQKEQLTQEGV